MQTRCAQSACNLIRLRIAGQEIAPEQREKFFETPAGEGGEIMPANDQPACGPIDHAQHRIGGYHILQARRGCWVNCGFGSGHAGLHPLADYCG